MTSSDTESEAIPMMDLYRSILLPEMTRTHSADVPLRLWDPGKWSDVKQHLALIGGGKVFNICGRLRLWGSNDRFSGVRVNVQISPPTINGGEVVVWAGADPNFNAISTIGALSDGSFDRRELTLCVLSTLDFSRVAPCDINMIVLSPVPPGASLGTSAALGVALNRAFLGSAFDPLEIALRTLEAELEICGKPTGNQDHLASSFGSCNQVSTPAIMIDIRDLYDVDVTPVPVGPNLRVWLKNIIVVFLGSHDSSEIHLGLGEHLDANPEWAKPRLTAMRATADATQEAFACDDVDSFLRATSAVYEAQSNLSHRLISDPAKLMIEKAMLDYNGTAIVPGAGGEGGSVVACFSEQIAANAFVEWADRRFKKLHLRFYEAQCPGIN